MRGAKQQITGLSKDATLSREREPGGRRHTNTLLQHRREPRVRLTCTFRTVGVSGWSSHTFVVAVTIELGDGVHCRGELELSTVPLLHSHFVISLSAGGETTEQH